MRTIVIVRQAMSLQGIYHSDCVAEVNPQQPVRVHDSILLFDSQDTAISFAYWWGVAREAITQYRMMDSSRWPQCVKDAVWNRDAFRRVALCDTFLWDDAWGW